MERKDLPYFAVVSGPSSDTDNTPRDYFLIGGSARATPDYLIERSSRTDPLTGANSEPHLSIHIPLHLFERVEWTELQEVAQSEAEAPQPCRE